MTVILKMKEPLKTLKPNSEHGYIIDIFDTVEDFKVYLKEHLLYINRVLKKDETSKRDEELETMCKAIGSHSFHELYSKYLEYNSTETIEII